MANPLVVLGSINADLYVEIERLPQPGETIPGTDAAIRPGGKGANQAVAAARLGRRTRFLGQWGDDAHAAVLKEALSAAHVDIGMARAVPGPSGQAYILLQKGGENSIIIVGGANHAWSEPTREMAAAIATAGTLLLQREVPETVNLAAAVIAAGAGVPVVMDAGGAMGPLPRELLQHLAVLSPNETELARLTGLPTAADDEVLAAARALQRQGVHEVLVKLGSRGAMLLTREGSPLVQHIFPAKVVDTTGAGDCFTAAFVVARMEGRRPADCLRFAAAAAAICVQKKGAIPSLPHREEVDRLMSAL